MYQQAEIMKDLLNCNYLWQLVRNRAKSLLYYSETLEANIYDSKAETLFPDEAMDLIRKYEDAVEQEIVYREKKEAAANKLKVMLGAAESGSVGNRLVIWKNVWIGKFNEEELRQNEPELYWNYTDFFTYREISIR